MGIGYNSLIGALLTFLNDSWDSVKVVKSIENTVFRTFCCGELEIIGCYIKLNGETFRIEYNIMDCETHIVLNSGVNVYLTDKSLNFQKRIYNAINKQVIIPIVEDNK